MPKEIIRTGAQQTFPAKPQITLSDTSLQRLINASVNTLYNSAQETTVDGMARERQQQDLKTVDITTNTIAGPIVFKSSGLLERRKLILGIPAGTTAELILDKREKINLKKAGISIIPDKNSYIIKGGTN